MFSLPVPWPGSPEVQTHAQSPIVAAFPGPLILIWNAAGNPRFPDTRQAGGSEGGKLHLKALLSSILAVRWKTGQELSKSHRVISQAGHGERRVRSHGLLRFLDCQEVPGSLWQPEFLNSSSTPTPLLCWDWEKGTDPFHPSSQECVAFLLQHGERRGSHVSGLCLGEPGQPQSGRLSSSPGPVPPLHALQKPQQLLRESPT